MPLEKSIVDLTNAARPPFVLLRGDWEGSAPIRRHCTIFLIINTSSYALKRYMYKMEE